MQNALPRVALSSSDHFISSTAFVSSLHSAVAGPFNIAHISSPCPVREPATDFTVPNLQANLGISRLGHSAHAPYLVASELQTLLSKVMGVFPSAGSSVWDKEFVGPVSKRQALYGDTMRGQVPLQLILVLATGWDRSIFCRADGAVEAKIPTGENEDTNGLHSI
jgi:hypothetical protein